MVAPAIQPSYADLGLPDDYGSLSADEKQEARLRCLRSWYDPNRPDILCSDADAFVRAVRLWVTYYLKPAACNHGVYYYNDPDFKWEMIGGLMAPPIVPTEPGKCVIQAPRGSTKTVTVILQCGSMVLITRPGTTILISEFNDKRTTEEIKRVRRQIGKNERIHEDFGGAGELFPESRNKGHAWNDSEIELYNGSVMLGVSCMAAHRGRHPDWVIIDDPEKDKKKSRNQQWRREYFEWLFYVVMPMLHRGCSLTWVGTNIDEYSCLGLAMRGRSDLAAGDAEASERDRRFDDWTRLRFDLIVPDAKGQDRSTFSDHVSVEAFHAKCKTMGRAAALAEYQGEQIAGGEMVFTRDEFRHGYMKCVASGGSDRADDYYMLDLKTGQTVPWDAFVDSLAVFGANDIADSLDPQADPAASVFIGVDDAGLVYVLDVWSRHSLVDKHVPIAFRMAERWKAEAMGWEKAALQRIVVRWARQVTERLRAEGKSVPAHVAVQNDSTSGPKVQRIIGAISSLLVHEQLRFLRFEPVTTRDGVRHEPAPCHNRRHYLALCQAIDTMTDSGPSGFIDSCDALEMAIRVARRRKGLGVSADEGDNEKQVRLWREAGFAMDRSTLPPDCWTTEMLQAHREEVFAPAGVGSDDEVDPYE